MSLNDLSVQPENGSKIINQLLKKNIKFEFYLDLKDEICTSLRY